MIVKYLALLFVMLQVTCTYDDRVRVTSVSGSVIAELPLAAFQYATEIYEASPAGISTEGPVLAELRDKLGPIDPRFKQARLIGNGLNMHDQGDLLDFTAIIPSDLLWIVVYLYGLKDIYRVKRSCLACVVESDPRLGLVPSHPRATYNLPPAIEGSFQQMCASLGFHVNPFIPSFRCKSNMFRATIDFRLLYPTRPAQAASGATDSVTFEPTVVAYQDCAGRDGQFIGVNIAGVELRLHGVGDSHALALWTRLKTGLEIEHHGLYDFTETPTHYMHTYPQIRAAFIHADMIISFSEYSVGYEQRESPAKIYMRGTWGDKNRLTLYGLADDMMRAVGGLWPDYTFDFTYPFEEHVQVHRLIGRQVQLPPLTLKELISRMLLIESPQV